MRHVPRCAAGRHDGRLLSVRRVSHQRIDLRHWTRPYCPFCGSDAELALLVIHGVLHLLGYDHVRPDDKAVMWEEQAHVLAELGLANIQPTEG